MTARTCVGGHWPLAEYGPICPSCIEDVRTAITDEAFALRKRGIIADDREEAFGASFAAVVATRMMVAVEKVLKP